MLKKATTLDKVDTRTSRLDQSKKDLLNWNITMKD